VEASQKVYLQPDNSKLYVANDGENSISVIDTSTNKVIQTIQQVGIGSGATDYPVQLAFNADGQNSFVLIASKSVSEIDVASGKVLGI